MKPSPYVYKSLMILLAGILLFCEMARSGDTIRFVRDYISFTQVATLSISELPKRDAWKQTVPEIKEISIPRKGEAPDQPALWYHSGSEGKKPLLLVLHSWSADYLQHDGIPYGVFAEKNDWIFIHPDFRGRFDNEDATASELAIQDVLDALDYALANAPVDEERIYLAGFSGGAMMSLIMAGLYPEKFTAALAWVPVYDLNDWYGSLQLSGQYFAGRYKADIEASCGGNPQTDISAREECMKRSPSYYLEGARGKGVRFFISGGVEDRFVPPSHAIRAFNDLAAENEMITEPHYLFVDEAETLPDGLKGEAEENRFFEEAGLPVVFSRTSGGATLILFDGGHDMVYNAGLNWLSQQRQKP
jgi:predicted esterase